MYVLEYGKHAPVFVSEGKKLYSLKYVRGHNMPIMYAYSLARLGMCCPYSSSGLMVLAYGWCMCITMHSFICS